MVVAGTRVRRYDVARNGPTFNGSAMVLSLDDISYFIFHYGTALRGGTDVLHYDYFDCT